MADPAAGWQEVQPQAPAASGWQEVPSQEAQPPAPNPKFGRDYAPAPVETPQQTIQQLYEEAHPSWSRRFEKSALGIADTIGETAAGTWQEITHPGEALMSGGKALVAGTSGLLGGAAKFGSFLQHDIPQGIADRVAYLTNTKPVQLENPLGVTSEALEAQAQNLHPDDKGLLSQALELAPTVVTAMIPGVGEEAAASKLGLFGKVLKAPGVQAIAASNAGNQIQDAQNYGATGLQQLGAAATGYGAGLAQGGYFERLGGAGVETPSVYNAIVSHAGTGAGVMGGTQLAQNAFARATYDPTRNLMEGVPEQAILGAGFGLGGAAVHAAFEKAPPPKEAPQPMPETRPNVAAFIQAGDPLPDAQAQHQANWAELGALEAKHEAGNLTPEESHRWISLGKALRAQGQIGDGENSLVIPGMYSKQAMAGMDKSGKLGPIHVKLDIDNFKAINDTLGHENTDYLIQQIGTRLAQGLPEDSVIGRGTGGDEFESRGSDSDAIQAHLDQAVQDLKSTVVQVTDPQGNVRQINGIGLSFGIGENPDAAESALAQHKDTKLAAGERFTRAQVEAALAAEVANRRAAQRGESPERRGVDLGPAARSIPTVVRAAEPGERGIVGPPPFGGRAEGGPVPLSLEVGARGTEGGEPGIAGTGEQPAPALPAEATQAAGIPGIGPTEAPSETPAGGSSGAQSRGAEEVAPTLNYKNGNGEDVSVPLEEPHHQDAARAIEDEFQRRKDRIGQIPGDDQASKALRRKLYLQAADDRAQAKAALHVQMEEEALGKGRVGGEERPEAMPGWKPDETAKLDAQPGTPEAAEATAKLNEPVKRLIETSRVDVAEAHKPEDIGYQYEQARGQSTVDAINSINTLKEINALTPEDQSRVRDAVEDPRIQLPPWLQKFRDAIVEPLRDQIRKDYLALKALKGQPANAIDTEAEVAHATRRALPDALAEEPSWWKRALNIRSFDPGEMEHEFRTKGLSTSERGEKARVYKAMVDANGNREVAHAIGGGKSEGVKSGKQFSRVNIAQEVKARLEKPAARLARAVEKARTAFEETTQRLPARLARQAERLEAEGKGRADILKKIMVRGTSKSARVVRDLLSERHEIEHAYETGDKEFFHENNPKLAEQEESLRRSVNKEFWKHSDLLEKKASDLEEELAEAKEKKAPAGRIYDLEQAVENAHNQHRDQVELDAMQHPDRVIASSEDLQAEQKKYQDAVKAERDRMLKPVDAKLKAEAARDERNQNFIGKEAEKTQDIRAEAASKGATADVLDHRYDHMDEATALKEAAKEHPRVARAVEAVEKAQADVNGIKDKMGALDPTQRYFKDKEGNLYHQTEARTREIEASTDTRYDKNFLTNLVEQHYKMREALRNMNLIEGWQKTPAEGGFGYKIPEGEQNPKLPEGYSRTRLKIPGMDKWAFPDHMTRALDHLQVDLDRAQSPNDISRAFRAANRLFIKSIFLNPVGHILNTGYHYFTNKGFLALNPVEHVKAIGGLADAFRKIITMDHKTQEMMNEGTPMMLQNQRLTQLNDMLHQSLLPQLRQIKADDPALVKFASKIGAPVKNFMGALSKQAGNVLWVVDDAMRMEATQSLMKERPNLTFKQANDIVAEGIADYRSRKGASPGLRKFMEAPSLFMFSRYHQFRALALAHDLKNAFFPKATETAMPLQAQQEAMGKLAATALLAVVAQSLLTPAYQRITGDKEAHAPFAGSLALPSAIAGTIARTEGGSRILGGMSPEVRSAIYGGPRTGYQDAQDFLTLTPGANILLQEGVGRNLYAGQGLSTEQRLKLLLEAISPVGQAAIASRNPRSAWANFMGSFGARYKGTAAVETAKSIAAGAYGSEAPTDLDTAQREAKLNIASALYGKDSDQAKEVRNALIDEAVQSGGLTRKQASAKIEATIAPPERQLANLVGTFRGVNAGQNAMHVYRVATPEEKKLLAPVVQKKLSSASIGTQARAQNAALLKEFKALNEVR